MKNSKLAKVAVFGLIMLAITQYAFACPLHSGDDSHSGNQEQQSQGENTKNPDQKAQ